MSLVCILVAVVDISNLLLIFIYGDSTTNGHDNNAVKNVFLCTGITPATGPSTERLHLITHDIIKNTQTSKLMAALKNLSPEKALYAKKLTIKLVKIAQAITFL